MPAAAISKHAVTQPSKHLLELSNSDGKFINSIYPCAIIAGGEIDEESRSNMINLTTSEFAAADPACRKPHGKRF